MWNVHDLLEQDIECKYVRSIYICYKYFYMH
jgi:hypothetical protein